MKLIIDIPEEVYRAYKMDSSLSLLNTDQKSIAKSYLINGLINGAPLPKGHGRLGDLDELKKDIQNYHDDCATTSEYTRLGFETALAVVEDVDTIIEADKESENADSN